MARPDAEKFRPRILILIRYYLPGYRSGGPVRSLSNLVEALGDEFDFRVICLDHDVSERSSYAEIENEAWVPMGKAMVRYVKLSPLIPWRIKCAVNSLSPDLVYVNSFFDPMFAIFPLWLRRLRVITALPVLLAPRGEFSLGALSLQSTKKRAYLALATGLGGMQNLHWHATTDSEREDIRRVLGDATKRISVAANLGKLVTDQNLLPPRVSRGRLAVVYLSRITPKKNLLQAIRVVSASKSPLRFDIYGSVEDQDQDYWRKCQSAIAGCPRHVEIIYRGPVEHAKVHALLADYDAFFLPTLGENFGHAIVEAMSVGLPVLISDQTPWRGLQDLGVGYDLPLSDEKGFVEALEELASRTPEQIERQREHVLRFVVKAVSGAEAICRTRAMLLAAMGRSGSTYEAQANPV